MTTLTPPVPVDHPEDWGPDFARCGADNADAVVSIVKPGSALAVPDSADADQVMAAIQAQLPDADLRKFNGNAADLVRIFVPDGFYVMAQVYCDRGATPVVPAQATADHWITVYGDDTSALPWFQCWTNEFLTMTADRLRQVSHENDIHWHVLVRPAAAPPPGDDDDMGTIAVFDWDVQGSMHHVASVDGSGVLHVGWRPDASTTGSDWGDDPVRLANGSTAGGNRPNSSVTVDLDTDLGKLNVFTTLTSGDRGHWQYDRDSNTWSGLHL